MKKYGLVGFTGLLFAFIILMLGCSSEKEIGQPIDNIDYGKSGLQFRAVIKNADGTQTPVIQNGTLQKGKYDANSWEINMAWLEEYQTKVENIEITAVGEFPEEILQAEITPINLWILSESQFEEDGATPIKRFRNTGSVDIDTTDRNFIVAAFEKAFENLAENIIFIENVKYSDVNLVDKYSQKDDSTYIPVLDSTIPLQSGKMFFQINNLTKKFADDEVYIVALGLRDGDGALVYLNKDGNLVECSPSLNTIQFPDRVAADVSFKLSDAKFVEMKKMYSGRIYISYKKPIYVTFHGGTGYAGPDINNISDPNNGTYFEIIEFTWNNIGIWANTTRVDWFSFPVVIRLISEAAPNFLETDKTVGEIGTRTQIMAAWAAQAPAEFQPLKEEMRIMAPCKRNFNEGQPNGNYFDAYINQIWNQYANEDLVYKNSEGVTFRARVEGGVLVGKSHNFTVGKPTTQDAFEGKGELAKGEEPGRSVQAQLCAAINRGVAHKGEWYGDVSKYFTENPYNFYSKFIHENSYNGLAYSFCYSDVFNQEALIHHIKPLALVIDLKWD